MSESNSGDCLKINRRRALLMPVAGIGAVALPGEASGSAKTAAHQAPGDYATPRSAVAQTWDREYPAMIYGAKCPQRLHDYMSEDMLKLNIWAPSLSGKRPVLVYFVCSEERGQRRTCQRTRHAAESPYLSLLRYSLTAFQ